MKASRELAINIVAGDKSCYGADDPSKYGPCHHLVIRGTRNAGYCEAFGVNLQEAELPNSPYRVQARCADCRAAEVKE